MEHLRRSARNHGWPVCKEHEHDIKQSFRRFFPRSIITSLLGCAPTARVKAAIVKEPSLKATEINVETFKGKIQLSGFVNSQTDINKAVEIARGVKRVVEVKNDMRLK